MIYQAQASVTLPFTRICNSSQTSSSEYFYICLPGTYICHVPRPSFFCTLYSNSELEFSISINLSPAAASITLQKILIRTITKMWVLSSSGVLYGSPGVWQRLKCLGIYSFHHDFKTIETLQISSAPYKGFVLFAFVHQLQTSQTNKL